MAVYPPELAHRHVIEPDPNDIDCWINFWKPLALRGRNAPI